MHEPDTSQQCEIDRGRREFCVALGAAMGAACVAVMLPKLTLAADLPHVPEDDPTAKAMGYKEDTSKVDDKKYPMHKADQICGKCKYYVGEEKAEYGPCQIFAGKSVHTKGWCQVYMAK